VRDLNECIDGSKEKNLNHDQYHQSSTQAFDDGIEHVGVICSIENNVESTADKVENAARIINRGT
jgi:hypothetical protein